MTVHRYADWFCNRCRKEVTTTERERPEDWRRLSIVFPPVPFGPPAREGGTFDLCPDCMRGLREYLTILEPTEEDEAS